jgi:hypothetical protein
LRNRIPKKILQGLSNTLVSMDFKTVFFLNRKRPSASYQTSNLQVQVSVSQWQGMARGSLVSSSTILQARKVAGSIFQFT